MRLRVTTLVLVSCTFFACVASHAQGKYLDVLELRETVPPNGRDFIVVNEYRYLDPGNTLWTVPPGAVVNGASIPQALWSVLGGPWDGLHRNAAVIHDYFFDRIQYGSNAIHRVFYDALLTSGVNKVKAKAMYWAVLNFNPFWRVEDKNFIACSHTSPALLYNCFPTPFDESRPPSTVKVSPEIDLIKLKEGVERVEREDPPLESIEAESALSRDKRSGR